MVFSNLSLSQYIRMKRLQYKVSIKTLIRKVYSSSKSTYKNNNKS